MPKTLTHHMSAGPSHGRGRRFNPYSAHHPSLLRSYGWQASARTFSAKQRGYPSKPGRRRWASTEEINHQRKSPHTVIRRAGLRRIERRSGQVHGEAFEIGERAISESTFVGGTQDHPGGLARLKGFLPTRCAETPTIARLEAEETEFRHGRRKIVAAGLGEREKTGGHDRAHRVAAEVLRPGVAAAVAKEPGHRGHRAGFEPLSEHVAGCARPTAAITAVVPQHLRLRMAVCRSATRLRTHPSIFAAAREARESAE